MSATRCATSRASRCSMTAALPKSTPRSSRTPAFRSITIRCWMRWTCSICRHRAVSPWSRLRTSRATRRTTKPAPCARSWRTAATCWPSAPRCEPTKTTRRTGASTRPWALPMTTSLVLSWCQTRIWPSCSLRANSKTKAAACRTGFSTVVRRSPIAPILPSVTRPTRSPCGPGRRNSAEAPRVPWCSTSVATTTRARRSLKSMVNAYS